MMLLMKPLILSAVYWCCLVRSTESVLWPAGSYGIPKATSGCPSADGFQWLIGRRYQDTEDNNPSNHKSQQFHLDATVDSKRGILRSFCMKTDTSTDNRRSSWPPGKYCIYKKGGSCPPNLTSGFIKWDDEDDNNVNNKTGILPDGVYDHNTEIEFCCRTDGDKNDPINLPTLKPFFLLAYDAAECQQVKWATVNVEWIRFDNEDNDNADGKGGSYPHGAGINDHTIHYCYYQGCNKTLTGVSGLFNSPNHPGKYPDGQYCSWRITVTPAQQIHLKFTNFSLQSQNNTDSVSVYDGENATGKVLGVFYGGHPPPGKGVYSSSNYMFVIFKSDTSDSYAGFNASYKAIISAYNSRLTFVSSNSAILRTTSSCIYPTASTETLFASLKTEFMEVTPSKRPQLLTSSLADQIIASSRIQVAMTSSVSSNVPEAAGCNKVLTKESGTFHSPNYPSKYPDGQHCSWRITVSPATQIHLTFTDFSLQRDIGTDVLSVYDGENATGEVLGVFYGGQPPPKEGIYSSSNDMFVIFKSDRNDSYTGFNASYKAVNCSVERCSTVAVSTSRVTETPSSPVVYFSGSLSLDMRPTLSTELSVTSQISMPAIESSPTTLVPLPSVTEYASSITSRVIASSKTQQLMTSPVVGPLVQTKDCNKTLTGPRGSFHSPNFPRSYPNGQLCSWRIMVSPAQKIQLTFTNFSLQSENNTDIVIVHDGTNATGGVLGVFYGEHPPPKQGIQSSSNHMFVILKSDENDTYAGFMATYRAVNCSDNECSFPEGSPSSRVTSVKLSPTVPTMTSFYPYPIVTSYIKPQITSPYTELTSREQTEPTEPSEATMECGTVDAIESHNESDFNVAAVVAPVLLVVLLAILFIVGFFYYKRKGFVIYTRKTKEMDKEPKEIIEMSPFYDSPSSKTENPELSSTSCPRPISIENPSYNTSNDEFDVYSEVKTPEQNETEPDMEKAAINPLYESAA